MLVIELYNVGNQRNLETVLPKLGIAYQWMGDNLEGSATGLPQVT